MDKLSIRGNGPLNGEVHISGAKNAALPVLAASLLTAGAVRIGNIPKLRDIATMVELLQTLGARIEVAGRGELVTSTRQSHSVRAPYQLVKTMRASILVLGPLLARFGRSRGLPARRLRHRFTSGQSAHPGTEGDGRRHQHRGRLHQGAAPRACTAPGSSSTSSRSPGRRT